MPRKQPDLWQPLLLDVGKPRPKAEEKRPETVVEYDAPLLRPRANQRVREELRPLPEALTATEEARFVIRGRPAALLSRYRCG